MTVRSTILLLGLCMAGAACTTEEPATIGTANEATVETSEVTSLEDAVAAWGDAAADNYLVRAIDNDRTSLDAGCTWITEVHGTQVDTRSAALFDVECGDWDVSIPALHQQLIDYQSDVDQNGLSWVSRGQDA